MAGLAGEFVCFLGIEFLFRVHPLAKVVTLDTDAEELMQWTSEPDIATLLHNAWPLWGLLALLAGQRKHSFIITARDAPKAELFDQAPLLDAMWEKQGGNLRSCLPFLKLQMLCLFIKS